MKRHELALTVVVVLTSAVSGTAQVMCTDHSDCDDGSECTFGQCVLPGVCVYHQLDGAPCTSDSDPNTIDFCLDNVCRHVPSDELVCDDHVQCSDANPCTEDLCYYIECRYKPESGPCTDDGDSCTSDHCEDSNCVHIPITCEDFNPCTSDACNPRFGGCAFPPEPTGTPCSDGEICTINDACDGAGMCVGEPVDPCACPIEQALAREPGRATILAVLRDFRDTVLAASPDGRRYIDLYYRHGPEVSELMAENPLLAARAAAALAWLSPAISVANRGQGLTLTVEQTQMVDRLIGTLRRGASQELRADLDRLQVDLHTGGPALLRAKDRRRQPRQ